MCQSRATSVIVPFVSSHDEKERGLFKEYELYYLSIIFCS